MVGIQSNLYAAQAAAFGTAISVGIGENGWWGQGLTFKPSPLDVGVTSSVIMPAIMKLLAATSIALLFLTQTLQAQNSTEQRLKQLSRNLEYAVMPITDWQDTNHPPIVIGTAFLLSKDGYFVTAAHVLKNHTNNASGIVAIVRQANGDGSGDWFEEVERDTQHDLALCKMRTAPNVYAKAKVEPQLRHPFATLKLTALPIETGEFIVLVGFPLGSLTPAVQLGTVAATETLNPMGGRVPAGQRQLLQIAVSGNQGNSGSPVIDFDSGRVIGVVVQAVISPLFGPNATQLPVAQSSGLMLAAPASWLKKMLDAHHVVPDDFRVR